MEGDDVHRLATVSAEEKEQLSPRAKLLLGVERGSVRLTADREEQELRTLEGMALSKLRGVHRFALPPLGQRRALDRLLEEMRRGAADVDPEAKDAFALRKRGNTAAKEARDLLAKNITFWPYMSPSLSVLPQGKERQDVRWRLIRLLARDPRLARADLLQSALASEPGAIDLDTLLSLGERNFAPAVAGLDSRLKSSGSLVSKIEVAAYFGLRGDPRGRAVLLATVENPNFMMASPGRYFAAAGALLALGDTPSWNQAIANLKYAVNATIAQNSLSMAQLLALSADYFHAAAKEKTLPTLSELGWAIQSWTAQKGSAYESAAQLRNLIGTFTR